MNQQMIIGQMNNFLDKYDVARKDCVIGYGAAAVLYGLRDETGDIDIDISLQANVEFIETNGPFTLKKGLCGDMYTVDEHFDLHPRDTAPEDIVMMYDVAVVSLPTLLRQYEYINAHPDRCPAKKDRDQRVMARIRIMLADTTRETRDEQLAFVAHVLGVNVTEVQKTQNGNMFGTVVVDATDRVWYVSSSEADIFHFKRFKYLNRRNMPAMLEENTPTDMQFELKVQHS
jgi:hypothetical protein